MAIGPRAHAGARRAPVLRLGGHLLDAAARISPASSGGNKVAALAAGPPDVIATANIGCLVASRASGARCRCDTGSSCSIPGWSAACGRRRRDGAALPDGGGVHCAPMTTATRDAARDLLAGIPRRRPALSGIGHELRRRRHRGARPGARSLPRAARARLRLAGLGRRRRAAARRRSAASAATRSRPRAARWSPSSTT